MTHNAPLTLNANKKRYEITIENQVAFVEFIEAKGSIYLTHTEVPKALEGKGVGSYLVKLVLEKVKESGLRLVPLCPFVAMYLKRHPEWKELVLPGINIE